MIVTTVVKEEAEEKEIGRGRQESDRVWVVKKVVKVGRGRTESKVRQERGSVMGTWTGVG